VRELNKSLRRYHFHSGEIHGDMEQPQRLAELDRFKSGEINILVASDVAARGLDIKGVSHVFNFDAPWHPDDYVHRIGRTGRAGATGTAYTLVTPDDAENIANIEKLTGHKIERVKLPAGNSEDDEPQEASAPAEKSTSRKRGARGKAAPEAPSPPPKTAPAPRAERVEPRREAPARREPSRGRHERDEGPDEGWNGPVPDFLNFTIAS